MDHLHANNSFLELELACVPNSTISTCSTVKLLYDRVRGAKLEKQEQSSLKHLLKEIMSNNRKYE
jgi:hypothetical protein